MDRVGSYMKPKSIAHRVGSYMKPKSIAHDRRKSPLVDRVGSYRNQRKSKSIAHRVGSYLKHRR